MEIVAIMLIIAVVVIAGYLVMINVIYLLAPTKTWNTFPEKCNVKTKCTRVADSNNRGYGLKPPNFDKGIKYVEKEITKIIESIDRRLFTLTADTLVLPGHGDETTIGAERPHLDEWIDRGW